MPYQFQFQEKKRKSRGGDVLLKFTQSDGYCGSKTYKAAVAAVTEAAATIAEQNEKKKMFQTVRKL